MPFTSNTEGGIDRGDFSLIGERHCGRLNASEDTESVIVGGVECDVNGSIGSHGGPVD